MSTLNFAFPARWEIIHGRIVKPTPRSWLSSEVANRVRDELLSYGSETDTGRPRSAMTFHLPISADRTLARRPAVAFISYDRWPADRALPYQGEPAEVVPDLLIEVASPNDKAEELLIKAYEYLEAGARLVWLVFPALRIVHAYESADSLRRFKLGEELDGGTVLPGFRVPMANLFPPVTDFFIPDDE
jgi:Uma2 family endonuclease